MGRSLDSKLTLADRDMFKRIFHDQWEEFKGKRPQYNTEQYNNPVQKMFGCGDEFNGYSEHICMYCGRDRRRVPFSCKCCFCLSCVKQYVDNFVSKVGILTTVTDISGFALIFQSKKKVTSLTLKANSREPFGK
jgi:hypothetical protein